MRSNEFHGKDSIRYNGSERICSRLGDNVKPIAATGNGRLAYRTELADWLFRSELQELVSIYGYNAGTPATGVNVLISTGTSNDIFYYHTNHLGSTAFVTDGNATITQGFLYAPFGEITTEYAPLWQNGLIPNYTFNAKELDEETGMYYYEARYYNPPVFTSRDPMFEQKPWLSPYHYCSNNPANKVDPTEMDEYEFDKNGKLLNTIENKNADILRIVKTDRNGNVKQDKHGNTKTIAEKSFEYGTVSEVSNTKIGGKYDYPEYDATILNINLPFEKNRNSVFEFLAQNTNVEWGTILGMDKNGDYMGMIMTSHTNQYDMAGTFYLEASMFEKYDIFDYSHSHTCKAIGWPSGYSHFNGREPYKSGDHGMAIRHGHRVNNLRVFDSSAGRYYQYYKGGYQ